MKMRTNKKQEIESLKEEVESLKEENRILRKLEEESEKIYELLKLALQSKA